MKQITITEQTVTPDMAKKWLETYMNELQQLETVLENSGLVLSDAETIKQSYLPFFEQLAEIKEQSSKIDYANPTSLDESIARELRLKTVKIRTGSEALKNERKKVHLLRGNLEQDSWNLINEVGA